MSFTEGGSDADEPTIVLWLLGGSTVRNRGGVVGHLAHGVLLFPNPDG